MLIVPACNTKAFFFVLIFKLIYFENLDNFRLKACMCFEFLKLLVDSQSYRVHEI